MEQFRIYIEIDLRKDLRTDLELVDERNISQMVLGPIYLFFPAWSGADWYLTLSSQYKRSAGRNLGDTRHGTQL